MSPRVSSQTMQEFDRKQPFKTSEDRSSKYLTLAVAGVVLALIIYGASYIFLDKPYVAVYLTTGDVYFGKLNHSTGFSLSDPWFIEKGQNGDFALRRFADAIWKPSNTLDISSNQVVFWNRLPSDSPVISAMEGKGTQGQNALIQNQGNPAVNQAPSAETQQPTTQKKTSEKKTTTTSEVTPQN